MPLRHLFAMLSPGAPAAPAAATQPHPTAYLAIGTTIAANRL